jgi:sulfatase modifying factor 1
MQEIEMIVDELYDSHGNTGDPLKYLKIARELEAKNELEAAATAYDRAYGLSPENDEIVSARKKALDRLAIIDHGIVFRYIPAGTFLMGSDDGDPDEQPVHPVKLHAYWVSETPISWAKFCELMDFQPPPYGCRPNKRWIIQQSKDYKKAISNLFQKRFRDVFQAWSPGGDSQICHHYCENETTRAEFFDVDTTLIENTERPWRYDEKPMASVPYNTDVYVLGLRISSNTVAYRPPTEAEWEKAARGGLISAKYAWGDEPPTYDICDFGRFEEFSIRKMKAFPPNGYGLYDMCGGVWEWTYDWYDATYYNHSKGENPTGPKSGKESVLRGGSWADDAPIVTVSFRMSSTPTNSPTIGFRLCRVAKH